MVSNDRRDIARVAAKRSPAGGCATRSTVTPASFACSLSTVRQKSGSDDRWPGPCSSPTRARVPSLLSATCDRRSIQAAVSQELRLVRSRGSPQRVFLVPVGVGRNRLVCSSLPRQTPVTLSRDARVAGPRGPAELAPIHFFTRSEVLMFMNCPDCGLKVRLVAPYLLLERCPRCLVRRRQIVEMRVTTDLPDDASAPAPLRHSAG